MNGRRAILAAAIAIGAACSSTDAPIPETQITKMQIFLCSIRGAEVCQVRGDSIPTGQAPPRNEAFQVWAWHPGYNTTAWRLFWLDRLSNVAIQTQLDSAGQSINLTGFPDSVKSYGVRAYILGSTNGKDTVVVYRDSIMWTYP